MKTTKRHLASWSMVAAGLAVAMALPQRATAGDREWATAGKILTGVVAAHVLINAASDRSCEPAVVRDRVIVNRRIAPVARVTTSRYYSSRRRSCRPAVVVPRYSSRSRSRANERYDYDRHEYRRDEHRCGVGRCSHNDRTSGSVVIEINRYRRIYQPRVRGHIAFVQERRYLSSPWVSVAEHACIY